MSYTYEQLQSKSFRELRAIVFELGIVPSGDRRFRQTWIEAIENSPGVDRAQPVPQSIGKSFPVAEVVPIENSPGVILSNVTFSNRFLSRYSLPSSEKQFFPDADGQLNLLNFTEVEEPLDPDDYSTEFEFWVAYDDFYDRNPDIEASEFSELLAQPLEPLAQPLGSIELSLASMREWAPCPLEWYDSSLAVEGASYGRETVACALRDCIDSNCCFSSCKSYFVDICPLTGGRSPPGGDAIR